MILCEVGESPWGDLLAHRIVVLCLNKSIRYKGPSKARENAQLSS